MEPIISPWIIYAVYLTNKINTVAVMFSLILGTCMITALAMYFSGDPEDSDTAKKFIKKAWIPLAVCLAVLVIVPDNQTMMSMIVVQYITPDNINVVQGNIVDFVGQIMQAVKENVK